MKARFRVCATYCFTMSASSTRLKGPFSEPRSTYDQFSSTAHAASPSLGADAGAAAWWWPPCGGGHIRGEHAHVREGDIREDCWGRCCCCKLDKHQHAAVVGLTTLPLIPEWDGLGGTTIWWSGLGGIEPDCLIAEAPPTGVGMGMGRLLYAPVEAGGGVGLADVR